MVEITSWTEFKTREVLSKTYETRIFTDEKIRDENAHNSSIVDCRIYNLVTFFVINDLNQSVTVQVKGNRIDASVLTLTDVEDEFKVGMSIEGGTSGCSAYVLDVISADVFKIGYVKNWPFTASEIITGIISEEGIISTAKGLFSSATDLGTPGALDIGSSFTVAASDSGAKAIAALVDGVLPYMFAQITALIAPISDDLNCYVEKKYIE